ALDQLGPALDAFDLEHGPDRAVLELGVAVVRITPAGRRPLEQAAAELERAAQVDADLFEADADVLVAALVVFVFVFVIVVVVVTTVPPSRAAGNAVVGIIVADRHAETAALADPGETGAERG